MLWIRLLQNIQWLSRNKRKHLFYGDNWKVVSEISIILILPHCPCKCVCIMHHQYFNNSISRHLWHLLAKLWATWSKGRQHVCPQNTFSNKRKRQPCWATQCYDPYELHCSQPSMTLSTVILAPPISIWITLAPIHVIHKFKYVSITFYFIPVDAIGAKEKKKEKFNM